MSCAVVRADFVDYRTVKTRRTFQLIFEVPIEQQGDVFAKLGYPLPDTSTWCSIEPATRPGRSPNPATVPESRPPASQPVPLTGSQRDDPVAPCVELGDANHNKDLARSLQGKQRYQMADLMGKAMIRSARLAKNPAFQAWVAEFTGKPSSFDDAKAFIRSKCGIASRSEIADYEPGFRAFLELELDFAMARGRVAEVRS